ncbi:S-locus glycoprotein [Parasponia andersonii]|uniref:S-locus glycoprotein n=1 Tax=Parasponia andersonii TaxID=3476 RepID=A0A2P5BVZ5_PARAD|nr:S-locus glycoprotein [Parasponia andersonii]
MWQSFDYPSDTLLPGMKHGFNLRTGHKWYLSAWKNGDDPCPTDLTSGIEPHAYPELSIRKANANDFNGTKQRRLGAFCLLLPDYCDSYGLCGANGNYVVNSNQVCQCLKGFKPKSTENWNSQVWTEGCVRNSLLSCQDTKKDGFIKFAYLKAPDTNHTWVNWSMKTEECRAKCMSNCSCAAYSNTDIEGEGSGCAMWFGDLIDVSQIPGGGQDLYSRMPASELRNYPSLNENGGKEEDLELSLFDIHNIFRATDNFSKMNKLDEGDFGPVYRAWKLMKEGRAIEMIDECLKDSYNLCEVYVASMLVSYAYNNVLWIGLAFILLF